MQRKRLASLIIRYDRKNVRDQGEPNLLHHDQPDERSFSFKSHAVQAFQATKSFTKVIYPNNLVRNPFFTT